MGEIAGLEVGLPGGPDGVTAPWLTSVLRTSGAIDAATSVTAAHVAEFQAGGLLSTLATAMLELDGPGPASVVCKFPAVVETQRAMADGFGVYVKEVAFYREIAPRSNIKMPLVHAAMIAEDGSDYCIVMEDLRHLRQPDRAAGMTFDEAIVAVDALAAYHAGWHGSPELPALREKFFSYDSPVYRMGLPGLAEAGWPAAKHHAGGLMSETVIAFGDRWLDALEPMLDLMLERPTLCHHDWRADNIFFDENGDVIVIDPQIVGVTNPAFDLGYFISQSLEGETRAGRGQELIDRYVATSAEHGVELDLDEITFDTRVSIALCLMYGFVSYPEYEALPPEGQAMTDSLLRRSATTIEEFDAITAVDELLAR